MAKEATKKAAAAAEVENEVKNQAAAPVEAGTSPTNENAETGESPAAAPADIAQLQQEAADALNALWDAMRRAGYRAYTTLIFMGMAFDVEKDEEENQHYKPADLGSIETIGQSREEAAAAPFIPQPAQQTATTRNIMRNGGKFRSVRAGANDNNPAVK